MITEEYFRQYYESIYTNREVYVWGANHEIIDQKLTDRLYRTYGSATYNKSYYDGKLKEGKGRYGSDCSGSICPLSGHDNTARGYYTSCPTKGGISSIPLNRCCLVFNAKFTHVGAYLGNGYTIEMKSSKDNCVKQKLNKSRWAYYGIPSWITQNTDSNVYYKKALDKNLIKTFQETINGFIKDIPRQIPLKIDGEFGPKSYKAAVMAFQKYINDTKGSTIAVDGEFGDKTKRACVILKNGVIGPGVYLIQVMLYIKGYDMTACFNNKANFGYVYNDDIANVVKEYQNDTKGLRIDGIAGPATCYMLFNK